MRPAGRDGVPVVVLLHLATAVVVAAAGAAIWVAADRDAALRQAQAVSLGGLGYVVTWLLARRSATRGAATVALVSGATAAGLYYVTQYQHLALPEAKVAALDAIGRALSAPVPRLGTWSPFANSLATLLEGVVAVAAGLALARGSAGKRAWAAGCGAVLLLAVALSASRGAWIAVVVSLAAMAGHRALVRWPGVLAGAAAAVLLAAVAATVAGGTPWWMRWADALGRRDRLDVYGYAVALLRDAPFTGLGGGDQFTAAVSKYVLMIQVPFITYTHNLSLQVWLEQGLGGLAAWWALAAATALAAVAGERAGLGRRFRGLWAGLLAVHVHGLIDARQFVDAWTWSPFFGMLGLVAGYMSEAACRVPRLAAAAPLGLAAAVVAAAVIGRGEPRAAWHAGLGAVEQARADRADAVSPGAGDQARARAITRFEAALAVAPDDGPALRRLGGLRLDQGDFDAAAGLLARAWASEPGHLTTQKAYGLALVWTGDSARAAQLLAPVPGMASELATWSRWREDRGERPLAVAAARTSMAIAPDQPEVARWLAGLEALPAPPPPPAR